MNFQVVLQQKASLKELCKKSSMSSSNSNISDASSIAKLPFLDHLLLDDYEHVYEPSEDTYLMCDALHNERRELQRLGCNLILEIGSGSGCNITYLAKLLTEVSEEECDQDSVLHSNGNHRTCKAIATDINPRAVDATRRTAAANDVTIECIQTDLVEGLQGRLAGQVDVLLFNPPYVPTPDEEVGSGDIAASWAGGERGRRVIDRFLPLLPLLLTPATQQPTTPALCTGGRCYLVLVDENDPAEIAATAKSMGLHARVVLRRRARNEGLLIMKLENVINSP